ncbi:MAG: response regulator [Flavipsychrobacter sp.]|nr:response regulator [Flavipsychrobacter sp.]
MISELPNFIVIDDDPISNIICLNIIRLTFPGASVQTFKEAEKGIEYIWSAYSGNNAGNAILFLDINMPVLSGWEVLEKITDFPASVKERVKIFMLSSSVASHDQEKAENHPLVAGYIIKSLSQAKLSALFPC